LNHIYPNDPIPDDCIAIVHKVDTYFKEYYSINRGEEIEAKPDSLDEIYWWTATQIEKMVLLICLKKGGSERDLRVKK